MNKISILVLICTMLVALIANGKGEKIITAKMAFKLSQEGWDKPYYSWVHLACINGGCSWDEMTSIGCIGGKQADPYMPFPEIYHYDSFTAKQIKTEIKDNSVHITWKDGTGNFWFEFDCSKNVPVLGCKVKTARGTITDVLAEHTTKYEYIQPLGGTINMPCK